MPIQLCVLCVGFSASFALKIFNRGDAKELQNKINEIKTSDSYHNKINFSNNRVEAFGVIQYFYVMKNSNEIVWPEINASLNEKGFAQIPEVLSKEDCNGLIGLYPKEELYRNVINMQRYRFGQGEYKYFNYPLPEIVQQLRKEFYKPLSTVANQWATLLGNETTYPENHSDFISLCNKHKQARPTPLILHYQAGGFNTLHRDLYGEIYFPFQVVFVLSQRGADYDGGELVMTEQLPRAQSKANVIAPNQGDALIFTTNFRPVKGTRGYYKSRMKHGISELKWGERFALGIIFHDAL